MTRWACGAAAQHRPTRRDVAATQALQCHCALGLQRLRPCNAIALVLFAIGRDHIPHCVKARSPESCCCSDTGPAIPLRFVDSLHVAATQALQCHCARPNMKTVAATQALQCYCAAVWTARELRHVLVAATQALQCHCARSRPLPSWCCSDTGPAMPLRFATSGLKRSITTCCSDIGSAIPLHLP